MRIISLFVDCSVSRGVPVVYWPTAYRARQISIGVRRLNALKSEGQDDAGMLRPRSLCGLEAKLFGLDLIKIGFVASKVYSL